MAKKILIVDDEPLLLHALSRTLRSDGAEVMTASSGEDALIEFYGCSYDICFVDIHMGGISGLAVMKKIKELCPRTIVTIMSCYHLDEDTQGIIKETADYFIPKPFDIGQVKAIVKAAPEGIKEEENKPGGGAQKPSMDKRAHERQPFEKTVNLAVTPSHLDGVVTVRLRGAMIDISAGGVGMWTNSPFGAGDKIRFNDEVGTRSGTVKWNTMVSDMHAYRVGIQFT